MKRGDKMMTEIKSQMLSTYQQSMMKDSPVLRENPKVGDITGAAMRHIAAQTRRLTEAHA